MMMPIAIPIYRLVLLAACRAGGAVLQRELRRGLRQRRPDRVADVGQPAGEVEDFGRRRFVVEVRVVGRTRPRQQARVERRGCHQRYAARPAFGQQRLTRPVGQRPAAGRHHGVHVGLGDEPEQGRDEEHRSIFDAIARRDPEMARTWATVHIAGVEEWLRSTLTG
jgi:hypothetical protein